MLYIVSYEENISTVLEQFLKNLSPSTEIPNFLSISVLVFYKMVSYKKKWLYSGSCSLWNVAPLKTSGCISGSKQNCKVNSHHVTRRKATSVIRTSWVACGWWPLPYSTSGAFVRILRSLRKVKSHLLCVNLPLNLLCWGAAECFSWKYVTVADLYVIFLFCEGFTVEKVRLLLPSCSSFDKTCTRFATLLLVFKYNVI